MEPETMLWLLQLVWGDMENLPVSLLPKMKYMREDQTSTAEDWMKSS